MPWINLKHAGKCCRCDEFLEQGAKALFVTGRVLCPTHGRHWLAKESEHDMAKADAELHNQMTKERNTDR